MKQLFTFRKACFMGFKRVNKPNQKTILTLLLVLFAKISLATAPVITDLNKLGQPCETVIKFSLCDFAAVFTDADAGVFIEKNNSVISIVATRISFSAIIVEGPITNNQLTPPSSYTGCGSTTNPGIIDGSTPTGGLGAGTYTFQWESAPGSDPFTAVWTPIVGAVNEDYDPTIVASPTLFRRKVTSGQYSGYNITPVQISPVSSNVSNNSIQLPLENTKCGVTSFDPAQLMGTVPNGSLNYQWQQGYNENGPWSNIPGETGRDYNPPTLTQTTFYRRAVLAGGCTDYSEVEVIRIAPLAITNNNILSGNQTVSAGQTPALIIGSQPSGGDGSNYSYLWHYSTNGGINWQVASGTATGKNYQPGQLAVTTYFRREVIGGCNSFSNPVIIGIVTNIVDLDLTKTATLSESTDNGIDYSIKVVNNGPQDADSVIVRDKLAPNVKYLSGNVDKGTVNYNESTHEVIWTMAELKNDDKAELKLTVEVSENATISNTASVSGGVIDKDPDLTNNSSTATISFVPFAIDPSKIANMITPNGDGKNDFLKFPQMDVFTNNELLMFDRWGNTVYSTKGYQNNWSGEGLSEGTYFYVLKVQVGGKVRQFKGYLTLVRNRFNG